MAKKKAVLSQLPEDASVEMEDVTVYPAFETQMQVVSAPTGDALPAAVHDMIVKLNADGCHVVATNIIQTHLYEGNDHRAVLTYVKAPVIEKRPAANSSKNK